jgi:hypothetical protein
VQRLEQFRRHPPLHHLADAALRREQRCGAGLEGRDLRRRREVGFRQREHIGDLGGGERELVALIPDRCAVGRCARGERRRIDEAEHALEQDAAGGLMREQFLDDARRMTDARGLDQDARGARTRDQLLQRAPEVGLARAAQAAARYQAYIVRAARSRGDGQGVDARVSEFIEEHRPVLVGGLGGEQPRDQRGLAAAQGSGDDPGGDRCAHPGRAHRERASPPCAPPSKVDSAP